MTLPGEVMLSFPSFCLLFFGGNISLDFLSIGVVVSQCRMNLCERQVAHSSGNFLGREAQFVPTDNPSHGDARSGNPGTSTANLRRLSLPIKIDP